MSCVYKGVDFHVGWAGCTCTHTQKEIDYTQQMLFWPVMQSLSENTNVCVIKK